MALLVALPNMSFKYATCFAGEESPSEPVNVLKSNDDGTLSLTLPGGNIGAFNFPKINGTLPSMAGVTVIKPNIPGRRLKAEWWQVLPPISSLFMLLPRMMIIARWVFQRTQALLGPKHCTSSVDGLCIPACPSTAAEFNLGSVGMAF